MTTIDVRHRRHRHGYPPVDEQLLALPEAQPMILRLGLAVGDVNAHGITRSDVAARVAASVLARRTAR